MANLKVLVPDGTTNYITNPAMRYDTTGWNVVGSTITRNLDYARFGIASLKVVTAGTALREGAYYRVNALEGMSTPVTASIYVRGSGRVRLRMIDNPRGKEWVTEPVALNTSRWKRLSVSGFSTGSNDVRLYVETTGAARATTFYVDGAQMETKAYPTTYCDGDQPGCRWNLVNHGSISIRDAYTRQGGRWVELAGPCREDEDLYVTSLGGLGMAGVINNIQSWSNAPGAYYQNTKVTSRVVTMSFHAKKSHAHIVKKANLSTLHELRQQLIDILKPDRTQGGEAFMFEYDEGDRPLYLWMRYEAGLEGEWDIRNPYVNSFPVRFLVVDPMLCEDNYHVQQLEYYREIPKAIGSAANYSHIIGRVNEAWNALPGTTAAGAQFYLDNDVYCMAVGPKGELYVGGDFTINGLNRIAKWDGTRWSVVGAGGANGAVYALAIGHDGELYATGAFTSIGGVACNYIAKWNGTVWAPLSTGLGGAGRALCVTPNALYVGGTFTSAGALAAAFYVVKWDGSFHACGSGANPGVNQYVYALAYSAEKVYVGGTFTANQAGTETYDYVVAIDVDSDTFEQIPGFNNYVYSLLAGPDGKIYAGGQFTEITFGGTIGDANRVAVYVGGSWRSLGNGIASTYSPVRVYALAMDSIGNLYAGGNFVGYPPRCVAMWNGLRWIGLDMYINVAGTNPNVWALASHPNGDLYVGIESVSANFSASSINTVQNYGSAEVKPLIYIRGYGILRYIENMTTGKRVTFYSGISASDEVVIDFAAGTVTSPNRGNIIKDLMRDGDFQDFNLVPGENKVAMYITNGVSCIAQIGYKPVHWSVDAVVDAEDL